MFMSTHSNQLHVNETFDESPRHFTAGKLIALISVITMGGISFSAGDTNHFENAWEGNYDGKSVSYAFMQGLFAFAGWNYLVSRLCE